MLVEIIKIIIEFLTFFMGFSFNNGNVRLFSKR